MTGSQSQSVTPASSGSSWDATSPVGRDEPSSGDGGGDPSALARELVDSGALRDPRWMEVLAAVPREPFVPRFHRQEPCGAGARSRTVAAPSEQWARAVARDVALSTRRTQPAQRARL